MSTWGFCDDCSGYKPQSAPPNRPDYCECEPCERCSQQESEGVVDPTKWSNRTKAAVFAALSGEGAFVKIEYERLEEEYALTCEFCEEWIACNEARRGDVSIAWCDNLETRCGDRALAKLDSRDCEGVVVEMLHDSDIETAVYRYEIVTLEPLFRLQQGRKCSVRLTRIQDGGEHNLGSQGG